MWRKESRLSDIPLELGQNLSDLLTIMSKPEDQTSLHLAIARQDQHLVKQLCETIHKHYDLSYLLDQCTSRERDSRCLLLWRNTDWNSSSDREHWNHLHSTSVWCFFGSNNYKERNILAFLCQICKCAWQRWRGSSRHERSSQRYWKRE